MAPVDTPQQCIAKAERLEALAVRLGGQAAQFRAILTAVRDKATPRTWTGDFAERSTRQIGTWQRDLEGAADDLDDTADYFRRRARELRQSAATAGAAK